MSELSGVLILAGGESSRMGRPKALLALPTGKTLIEYQVDCAKSLLKKYALSVPIFIADNHKNFYTDDTVIHVDDYLPSDDTGKGAGALSAIVSVMDKAVYPNDYILVLSCDNLIGADGLFDELLNYQSSHPSSSHLINSHADVIYFKDKKDYPLLGLYRNDLSSQLYDYLDKGERSVMRFLSCLNTITYSVPSDWQYIINFNTPDEFDLALYRLNG